MNNVLLTGRLTKNAELLSINKGNKTALKFTLAVQRTYKNSSGEKGTDFIPVIYFIDSSSKLIDYLEKGRLISVSGNLRVHCVENEGKSKKYYTDVVANKVYLLDSKNKKAL